MSAQHPLAHRPQLVPVDLAGSAWAATRPGTAARQGLDALFAHHRLPPPIVAVEIGNMTAAVLMLVRASELLAMVPRSIHRATEQYGLRQIEIPDFQIARPIHCITRRGAERSPLREALRDLILVLAKSRHARA